MSLSNIVEWWPVGSACGTEVDDVVRDRWEDS